MEIMTMDRAKDPFFRSVRGCDPILARAGMPACPCAANTAMEPQLRILLTFGMACLIKLYRFPGPFKIRQSKDDGRGGFLKHD
ncbi:MAG: hypothetical protein GTN81_12760 [Proteobacteria bacterium]|nr:hypothetical protein [Pseudomonadota bacterium]